jgi:hypothetical protein
MLGVEVASVISSDIRKKMEILCFVGGLQINCSTLFVKNREILKNARN